MERYSDEEYWNKYWEGESRDDDVFYFSELVDKYVDWEKIDSYMEIGGAPGSIMAYMNKIHGVKVSTIDFVEKRVTENFLKKKNVSDFCVFQEDFERIDIKEHMMKYDMVASWGFVEHFSKEVCSRFIDKQKLMVSEGGYLLLEVPNIRKVIWLFYFLFNRQILQIHNFDIMNLSFLKNQIEKTKDFEIQYSGYYLTMNQQNEYFVKHTVQRRICKSAIELLRGMEIRESLKRWLFPYIVIVAKRK